MPHRFQPERLRQVLADVERVLLATATAHDARHPAIEAVPEPRRASAENLAHYLAVRSHDLRPLQRELRDLSLSSLGRLEGNVAHTLQGVRMALLALLGELPPAAAAAEPSPLAGDAADQLLSQHAVELLGPAPTGRQTRVMVTLPSIAAGEPMLLRELLQAGMDVARLNLAHDDTAAWDATVRHLRDAERDVGRTCKLLVDLPGPKLRTGALEPGPEVLRVRPERDVFGATTRPAAVAFHDPNSPSASWLPAGVPRVALTEPLLRHAAAGDELVVTDTRGRKRRLQIARVDGGTCLATVDRTCYLGSECRVALRRGITTLSTARLGRLPALPSHIDLVPGDALVVTRDQRPGRPARAGADGRREPARIPCTLPEVFDDVRPEQRILFDDGKIAGIVLAHDGDELRVRITATPPGGARLHAEKGINLPDTEISAAALGAADGPRLDWAARHADLIGMSFVQRPEDVLRLHRELERRGRPEMGILLKIETALAFQRLPDLLFAGLCSPPLGVMVARGDLAVEVGYARLAEVQEEILWLCEAAHVPVVWATQVLDSMARTGVPSRAEVTDAAMGVRAECVMLNKGPHIAATVQFLVSVLERMQQHHAKKRSLLRRLRIAGGGGGGSGAATR